MRELLETSKQLSGKQDKALVDSVLQVSVTANEDLIERLRDEKRMCEALMELFEPEIQAREEKAAAEAMRVAEAAKAEAEAAAEKRIEETQREMQETQFEMQKTQREMQEMKKAVRLIQGGCSTVEELVAKGISRSVAEDVLEN